VQRIHGDLSSILNILEGRFLYLVTEGAHGAIPLEVVINELSFLSRDLKTSYRRLGEIEERRDLSFKATKQLQEIAQRCLWLFRKMRAHQTFLKRLGLEADLRKRVSPEAFTIYQTLLNLDEEERAAVDGDDGRIRALILEAQE
jgi:hypothetical protein